MYKKKALKHGKFEKNMLTLHKFKYRWNNNIKY